MLWPPQEEKEKGVEMVECREEGAQVGSRPPPWGGEVYGLTKDRTTLAGPRSLSLRGAHSALKALTVQSRFVPSVNSPSLFIPEAGFQAQGCPLCVNPPVREEAAEPQSSPKAEPCGGRGRTSTSSPEWMQGSQCIVGGHRDHGWGPGPTVRPQEVGAELDLEDWGEENQQGVEWPFLVEERETQELGLLQSSA